MRPMIIGTESREAETVITLFVSEQAASSRISAHRPAPHRLLLLHYT